MKIQKNRKVEKVCSTDKTKMTLNHMYLKIVNKEQAVLIATDGVMLVHVPVAPEGHDREGLVPPEALKYARRVQETDEQDNLTIDVSDKVTVKTSDISASYERMSHLTFPTTTQVFPKHEPRAFISFSVERLRAIADAMGTDQVFLEIRETDSPIVIRPDDQSDMVGVLMPMKSIHSGKKSGQKEI